MKINKETMLFEELSYDEAEDLRFVCEDIVLAGNAGGVITERYFNAWAEGCGLDAQQHQRMMMLAVVFPQRALMSLVNFYKDQK